MMRIKVASSDDLRVISAAARAGWMCRTLPEGADDQLSDRAAHILSPVYAEEPRVKSPDQDNTAYVRVRASIALKGEVLPSECFLDVREDYWELLMDAAEAVRLAKLSTKWFPPSPCAQAEKMRTAS